MLRPVRTRTQYPVTLYSRYIINEPNLCHKGKKVSCLVMVHTAPAHSNRRFEMRRTWLNTSHYVPEHIVVIFLMGTVKNQTIQQALHDESRIHSDIIQGDFIDSYRNLSNKGVMGYRWISENCRNAEIVIKTDDDAFINMFKFFEKFSFVKEEKRSFSCMKSGKNMAPIQRDMNNKWGLDKYMFRGLNWYPFHFCSGIALFISPDLFPALLHAAYTTPVFWIDDIYLFGILPSKLLDVKYIELQQNFTIDRQKGLDCFRQKEHNCPYLVVTVKDGFVEELWNIITNG
ncbi:hypothetical protein FSP39_011487 [Pinctada imbricata]|uniref:Hexosyltransferase n=1 Tax=Pinctada imbricata TaxID=66713 RepID=A0AA89BSY2_PINIB|nr:hypothetical protein FSP39_011487 [Pinctada imbricata]